MITLDKSSGSGVIEKRLELNSPKFALVVVLKCDGEAEQVETLANNALQKCRESLTLSGLNPSAVKYCYVFNKATAERAFVECKIDVGDVGNGEDGAESFLVDERQGAKQPIRVMFGDRQNVIVAIAFCDGDKLVSGFASSAQAQAYGVFENAGIDVESMRYQFSLTPNGEDTEVWLSVHQGVIIDD